MHARRIALLALAADLALVGAAPVAPPPGEAKVPAEHFQAQRDGAKKTYERAMLRYRRGEGDPEAVYRWSRRWLDAERELSRKPTERIAALVAHLERMKQLEDVIKNQYKAGLSGWPGPEGAEFYRVEAEGWLAREKASR